MRFTFAVATLFAGLAFAVAGCASSGLVTPPVGGAANADQKLTPNSTAIQSNGARVPGQHHSIGMKHVLTWDNLGWAGATLHPWSLATPWLTYASVRFVDSAAIYRAKILPAVYTDPNRQGPGDPMYTNDESTFAHDCNGARIQSLGMGVGKFLMDPHSAVLATLWQTYVLSEVLNGASFAYVFEDKADTINKTSATPCNFDQSDWTQATNTMDLVLGYTIIYNSLGNTAGPNGPQIAPSFGLNVTTAGGMSEDCYVTQNSQPYEYSLTWLNKENTEIDMAAAGKLFVCDGTAPADAASSAAMRIYYTASALLTYDPNTTIFETVFRTPSKFHVLPETQLVPKSPLVAQPSTIDGLYQSGGGYGREYARCYYAGNYVGACAAFVNPNKPGMAGAPFPWAAKYKHTLVVSGSDVLDGGTASTTGGPPPATLDAGTAVIAFQ